MAVLNAVLPAAGLPAATLAAPGALRAALAGAEADLAAREGAAPA